MASRTNQEERIDEKAWRLAQTNSVIWTGAREALVHGDHGAYRVTAYADGLRCTCDWGYWRPTAKPCSHIIAASLEYHVQVRMSKTGLVTVAGPSRAPWMGDLSGTDDAPGADEDAPEPVCNTTANVAEARTEASTETRTGSKTIDCGPF